MSNKFLTGLIGRNIKQSLSPVMHEREADAQGIRLIYSLIDFAERKLSEADLPRILDALQTAGFAGVNVTHPYKQAIIAHLDELSSEAQEVGAVNTVSFRSDRRIGYNTDVSGFKAAFERSLKSASLSTVVQIGAGGAGSATAYALMSLGVETLLIHDLDRTRAGALAEKLSKQFDSRRVETCADLADAIASSAGIVNATPMGMAEHPGLPVPRAALRQDLWVADIVYFPLETALLAAARQTGCRVMDGSGMATLQAAGAFEVFTGLPADANRMAKTFREHST